MHEINFRKREKLLFVCSCGRKTMMKYLQKKQGRRTAETPFSTYAATGNSSDAITEMDCANLLEHIQVGSYYQIDHSSLPPNSPVQLFSIRLVMVSMKTQKDVALRYPSICSLRAHFSNWTNNKFGDSNSLLMNPANDEKYVMEAVYAEQVLYRRVTSEEFVKRRDSWDFWVVEHDIQNNVSKGKELLVLVNENDNGEDGLNEDDVVCKKGTCLSMLKSTGMVRWGNQHRVKFIDRHREDMELTKCDDGVGHDEEETVKEDIPNKDGKEEIIAEEEEEEEEEEEKAKALVLRRTQQTTPSIARRKNRKRKCKQKYTYKNQKSRKRLKQESNKVMKLTGGSGSKKCISRWSVERYKLAEENMLKIMKAKGAVVGNPIMRAVLRQEARKMIGDTGLLDHLLKHMAGKLAPGGEERFRRRHNAEGAMEYWLESANLVDIRKMAGIQDSYWTPPPGWTPGDNPSQDPNCAKQIIQLKEEIVKLKRDVEEIAHKMPEDDRAITQNSFYSSQSMDHNSIAALSLEDKYEDLMKKQLVIQKQLMEVSDSLKEVKEEIEKNRKTGSDLGTADKDKAGKRIGGEPDQRGMKRPLTLSAEMPKHSNTTGGDGGGAAATERAEAKAAKIERLKSGFRICKPQGTFLWPNSNTTTSTSPHQLVVLTPPSVNSAATALKQPPSPVRPTVKRGAATMTLSSMLTTEGFTKSSSHRDDDGSSSAAAATEIGSSPSVSDHRKRSSATFIDLIDLNDVPGVHATSSPICTYRRRNHQAGSSPSWLSLAASDSSSPS